MDFANIKFVFLDRDGVLNRKPRLARYITCWQEFELLPGVEEALARLRQSGRKTLLVTNQRGVALGLYSLADLTMMHARLQQRLAAHGAELDAIYVCPHDAGQCDCRKPQTGLFLQAFRDFPTASSTNSIMVGDSQRDIEAGQALGMPTVLIDDGDPNLDVARTLADLAVSSLPELVNLYLCP